MTHEARKNLLDLLQRLRADAVRRGDVEPDYLPRVDVEILQLKAAIDRDLNPLPHLPPSRLALVQVDDAWVAVEGQRTVAFRTELKGLQIVHAALGCANGTLPGPLPPEAFCDGLRPRQAVDKAIAAAASLVELEHGMRWLAMAMRKVKVRTTASGQELVRYTGEAVVDTTRV